MRKGLAVPFATFSGEEAAAVKPMCPFHVSILSFVYPTVLRLACCEAHALRAFFATALAHPLQLSLLVLSACWIQDLLPVTKSN